MENQNINEQVHKFFDELKGEIVKQVAVMNQQAPDGDLHDGFTIYNLDDGWVSYKGFSWGFVDIYDPPSIDMTFGPDWPFTGYRVALVAEQNGNKLKFTQQSDAGLTFTSPCQIASYGLQRLAAKLHDESFFTHVQFLAEEPQARLEAS